MPADPFLLTPLALPIAFAIAYAVKPKTVTQPAGSDAGPLDPASLELMRPGPEHQRLARLVGTWTVDCTMWMKPGEDPVESTGRAVFSSLYDGRFITCEFTGSFMGQTFLGCSTSGYDRVAKRYFTTWNDNMATGFIYLSGTSDDGGKTITYTGESVCPRNGPQTLRHVETHLSEDRFRIEMFQRPRGGGAEVKQMELVYTRT